MHGVRGGTGDGGVANGTRISTSRRRNGGTTLVRRGRFLAERLGRGGRVIAAVKRLLDCSLGRVDAAIDDLLRAWYKDRVKGLLGIVRATCRVLEGGRRHVGKARALLRAILQNSEGMLQAQCRRRSLVCTSLRTMGRGRAGARRTADAKEVMGGGWDGSGEHKTGVIGGGLDGCGEHASKAGRGRGCFFLSWCIFPCAALAYCFGPPPS